VNSFESSLFGNFHGTFPLSTAVAVLSFAIMDGNFLRTSVGTFPISVAVLPFYFLFLFFVQHC